ncbi:probable F-box protein At2g36090 [Typha latifolia]|uniref:probable F-box protein At2g36090 n=1 Tax=Typha latifolia TaxID=4733 RepID=UPI003C2DCEC6
MATHESPCAADTTSIDDLHVDVMIRALRLLDGPSLAAASCATAHLRVLASDPATWRDLCLSTSPSLRLLLPLFPYASYRSFFSDALTFPDPRSLGKSSSLSVAPYLPRELISAVDLHHDGSPVLSRVIRTDAFSPWFLGSPFRIDAVDGAAPPTPAISSDKLSLSWIIIDPARRRAVNVSSRSPVAVDRHWYTGEKIVRFATVVGKCSVTAAVTCGKEAGQVREVSLGVEDADGIGVNGRGSLVILTQALESVRKGRGKGEEEKEAKKRYFEFVKRKMRRKEKKARREWVVDFCCIAVGIVLFLASLKMAVFR